LRNSVSQRRLGCNIRGDLDRAATGIAYMLGRLRQAVVGSPVKQGNVRAALRKTDGDPLPNSTASARDNGDPATEVEQFRGVKSDVRHRSSFLWFLKLLPIP
jgi:hypothetical protein